MTDPDWLADKARIDARHPLLSEQSAWPILVYRLGRRLGRRSPGLVTRFLDRLWWLAFRGVETMTGISLPREASIGAGLRIWHFGGIFVHPASVIGARCTLRQGVTIGNRVEGGPAPRIGNDVELGAYAQVIGGVTVGDGARIGAMSVVLADIPAGATAVGAPARVVHRNDTRG